MNAFKFNITRGFTLIEVTLALGVISFAFIGLLGLLPAGMQSFRSTMDISVRSQIVQRISSDAMQTDFDTLVGTPSTTRYFDDQGTEVNSSQSVDLSHRPYVYQVRVTVTGTTSLPAATGLKINVNLATVEIEIVNNPAHVSDPFSVEGNRVFKTTTFVARNERK